MTCLTRCMWWFGAAIFATVPMLRTWASQEPGVTSSSWCAAYIHDGGSGMLLTIFPLEGPERTTPLPSLPRTSRVIASSSDGRAIYVQETPRRGLSDAITKVELKPRRSVTLSGSVGSSTVWYLTDSQRSIKIFGSGWYDSEGGHCGAFELDPDAGLFRKLRIWDYPDCVAGRAGPVSSDGRRLLSRRGNGLEVLNLETDLAYPLGTGLTQGSWSPDGRWIAAWGGGGIVVVDADDPSRRRNLGRCCENGARWSPDSRYLLLSKSELRCTMYLFFDSLEVLDVQTGKRATIRSSHCNVGAGWIGWIDPKAMD